MFYFFNIIRNLHQPFMAENPPTGNRNEGGKYQRKDKSPWFFLYAVDEIHTEEWCH